MGNIRNLYEALNDLTKTLSLVKVVKNKMTKPEDSPAFLFGTFTIGDDLNTQLSRDDFASISIPTAILARGGEEAVLILADLYEDWCTAIKADISLYLTNKGVICDRWVMGKFSQNDELFNDALRDNIIFGEIVFNIKII